MRKKHHTKPLSNGKYHIVHNKQNLRHKRLVIQFQIKMTPVGTAELQRLLTASLAIHNFPSKGAKKKVTAHVTPARKCAKRLPDCTHWHLTETKQQQHTRNKMKPLDLQHHPLTANPPRPYACMRYRDRSIKEGDRPIRLRFGISGKRAVNSHETTTKRGGEGIYTKETTQVHAKLSSNTSGIRFVAFYVSTVLRIAPPALPVLRVERRSLKWMVLLDGRLFLQFFLLEYT